MLKENIKLIRKSKGLPQEELALKLNVVRQTISKWEQGLSVPDSEMLIRLSKILETPINTLLGENILEPNVNNLKVISEKLEKINLQVSKIKSVRIKMIRWTLISLCVILVIVFMSLILLNSPYLKWNYNNTETAVLGVFIHIFEWIFIRLAPFILTALVIILFFIKKKV